MKAIIFGLLLGLCVAILPTAVSADEIRVTVDGNPVAFADQLPANIDGRVLVPVRGVFEVLGFDVAWERPDAILTRGEDRIVISIGSDYFMTNETRFYLDVPAQIIGGSTMLPLRFVLESIGYELEWQAGTVVITTDNPLALRPNLPNIVTREPDAIIVTTPEHELYAFEQFLATLVSGVTATATGTDEIMAALQGFIDRELTIITGNETEITMPTVVSQYLVNMPRPQFFSRADNGMLEIRQFPMNVTMDDVRNERPHGIEFLNLVYAWELLHYGYGNNDNAAALLEVMAGVALGN